MKQEQVKKKIILAPVLTRPPPKVEKPKPKTPILPAEAWKFRDPEEPGVIHIKGYVEPILTEFKGSKAGLETLLALEESRIQTAKEEKRLTAVLSEDIYSVDEEERGHPFERIDQDDERQERAPKELTEEGEPEDCVRCPRQQVKKKIILAPVLTRPPPKVEKPKPKTPILPAEAWKFRDPEEPGVIHIKGYVEPILTEFKGSKAGLETLLALEESRIQTAKEEKRLTAVLSDDIYSVDEEERGRPFERIDQDDERQERAPKELTEEGEPEDFDQCEEEVDALGEVELREEEQLAMAEKASETTKEPVADEATSNRLWLCSSGF